MTPFSRPAWSVTLPMTYEERLELISDLQRCGLWPLD